MDHIKRDFLILNGIKQERQKISYLASYWTRYSGKNKKMGRKGGAWNSYRGVIEKKIVEFPMDLGFCWMELARGVCGHSYFSWK